MHNVGLIGFGRVAEKAHAPAWKASTDFTVIAVAEADAGRRSAAAIVFPDAAIFETPEAMLAACPAIDLVDIATPPFLHVGQAAQALAAGRNVLCEKPLALSGSDFLLLSKAARESGCVLFTAHNWKHAPIYVEAAKLLRSGAIGKVHHAELHVLREKPAADAGPAGVSWRTDPKRAGGGILVDHGWHAFYLLTHLLGQAPRGATARLRGGPSGADEEATVLVDFPATSALVHLTWRADRRANWGVFYGEGGTLELRDDVLSLQQGGQEPKRSYFGQKLSEGSAHPEWFGDMLEDLRAELDDPRRRGDNLREAAACVALIECCYKEAAPSREPELKEISR